MSSIQMSFCKVHGCRFPTTHITTAHECGNCSIKGHGVMECKNPIRINALSKEVEHIPFELQCCASGCVDVSTHTVDGHKCLYCKKFGHDLSECPIKQWDIIVDSGTTFGRSKDGFMEEQTIKLQARQQMGLEEKQIYTKVYGELGCTWFARRDNNFENIELFFMHSDNWGQYGPSTDDRPKLNKFLDGYRCIDKV